MTEEQIKELYKQFCKDTGRNGGVLIGASIKELLMDLMGKAYDIGYDTCCSIKGINNS